MHILQLLDNRVLHIYFHRFFLFFFSLGIEVKKFESSEKEIKVIINSFVTDCHQAYLQLDSMFINALTEAGSSICVESGW